MTDARHTLFDGVVPPSDDLTLEDHAFMAGITGEMLDRIVQADVRRLEADQARGSHPAGNRTFALYLSLKAAAEPLTLPRLVLDTGRLSPEE